jgi:hypothetical protein
MSENRGCEMAPAYIRDNFQPTDRLAVVFLNKRPAAVIQRLATAERLAEMKRMFKAGSSNETIDV